MKSGTDYELTVLRRSVLGKYSVSEEESAAWSFVDMSLPHSGWVQSEGRKQSQRTF